MTSDNVKYVMRQFAERLLPACKPREIVLPVSTGKVIALSGVRRSGKTFLFFDTIKRLSAQGVARQLIMYLNLEDDRLNPIRPEDLDMVLRSWYEVFPSAVKRHKYLFLDEVQNVSGWERWVRRLCDTEDIEVFVTGSSSHLLTRDMATALRGRSITIEVFPLSFREYLAFKNIEIVPNSADNESLIRHELEAYLDWGGFPEIVLAEEALRPLIMQEYSSLMLYRDVVERYSVRNERLMRDLLRHCFCNTATLLNVSKLHRDFTSLGYRVSKNTLFEYLEYLTDSFLVFLLPKRELSIRKQEHNPKKLHVIDIGLISAFQAFPNRNMGHKLETVVFLHNRRKHRELYYYSNGSEVDLCDADGRLFINTCWSLSDMETLRREKSAMEFGFNKFPMAEGRLIFNEYQSGQELSAPSAQAAWEYLIG